VAEATSAATRSAIVIMRIRRGVIHENRRLAIQARVPEAVPTAAIALAMHCTHIADAV
jgi:hypothetical protein